MRKGRGEAGAPERPQIEEVVLPRRHADRWLRRLGETWARLRYEPDELMLHVANRLRQRDDMAAVGRTALGRLYNRVTGQDPDFIELDGLVIRQLFELIGEDPPIAVGLRSIYRVPQEEVRRWHALAGEALSPGRPRRDRRRRRRER